jgi:putative ABC transport system ATP-binding protein
VPERSLSVENVHLSYGSGPGARLALGGVTAAFAAGEMTLLTGPSGSGKTSLLTLLGCILRPDSGEVHILGERAARLSEDARTRLRLRCIGFIFQSFRLFESLSARENVALALRLNGFRRPERLRRSEAVLSELGLARQMHLKPKELSGGEKQRVALARAIAHDPPIVLADEPTASLDSENGMKVSALLRQMAVEQRRIVVVVSHDERLGKYAHRRLHMLDGHIQDACIQEEVKS